MKTFLNIFGWKTESINTPPTHLNTALQWTANLPKDFHYTQQSGRHHYVDYILS